MSIPALKSPNRTPAGGDMVTSLSTTKASAIGQSANLARHTDADGIRIRPLAIDYVVGNDIRTDIYHANRFRARYCLRRHRAGRNHVSFHVRAPANTAQVDPRLSDVPY